MAMIIRKAPMVEKTVTGSFRITIDKKTAITISDKSNIVETDAERCFNPSSHR